MDVIVSTPQGEAEISVDAVHESVTIGDLLGRILSSALPSVVYIDGRPTPTGTLLSASGLLNGSVIDSAPPPEQGSAVGITLVQAAGEGGGNQRRLGPGRYSLGTARRANVAPLTFNQVLVPRCEVVVEQSGRVTVIANQGDLDGDPASSPAHWEQQRLRVGHRVFRLDDAVDDRAESLLPTPLGQVDFIRRTRGMATSGPEPTGRMRSGSRRLYSRRHPRVEATQPPPVEPVDRARLAFDSELERIRRIHLDLAEVIRRATQLSDRLWERRPGDDDAYLFSVGLADQRWEPTDIADIDRRDLQTLPSVPVLVDLATQRGIGFASTPPQARAAARALLLQACVAHSPADLDVVVLATPAGGSRWEWIKWLPHARGPHGVQLLSNDEAIAHWINAQRTLTSVVASIRSLDRPLTPSRLTLAVVDDPALWRGRVAMLRGLFAEAQLPVRFVALTDRADDIPAVCTTVVRIEANGAAEVDDPKSGSTIIDVVPFVLEHDVAVAAARKLSPLEDHGAQMFTKGRLPPLVPLASLIDPEGLDADRMVNRWEAGRMTHGLRAVVGKSESRSIELNLIEEGPHVLIVGAARSGKTELLRTIVASLLAGSEPSALNLVCIEPSDGSSFGPFADVDHLVAAVDRFDEHAGVRLLRAMQSEATRRAQLLSESHGSHLAIPRLVIAVDDADELMARHPAFLPQLIDLVDRSRHLGFHLIVATEQLPRSIDLTFKPLANIRIGLRMNDPVEAIALVGSREPALVSPHTPGRGALKIGEAAALPVQFASASAPSGDLLEITPFIIARELNPAERKVVARPANFGTEPTREGGLRQFLEVVEAAAAKRGRPKPPPILWPELPTELPYEQISVPRASTSEAEGAAFGLSDLPDDRTQSLRRWDPSHDGNLLVIGGSPAERCRVLATMLVAATARFPIDRLHGYVIDAAAGRLSMLAALESLAACGAVASNDDLDRILRVLVRLDTELKHRQTNDRAVTEPHIVLVVNSFGALIRSLEPGGEFELGRELLDHLISNGPVHGITTLMSSANESDAPARMLGQFQQRIILHLDDRVAYRALGVEPGRIPPHTPGRAITTPDLIEIQIASITDLAAITDQRDRPRTAVGPVSVERTPTHVAAADVSKAAEHRRGLWRLPVGLDTWTLQPRVLLLQAPGGALILGDAGSGKTTLLTNIARCALGIDAEVEIHAIASTWSPLLLLPGLTSATPFAGIDKWASEFLERNDREMLVLVDDADRLDGAVFERLAELSDPGLVVIAAGRTSDLELPSHWTASLRLSQSAVILGPIARDGAMFGLRLRVNSADVAPRRGLLIDDGTTTPILVPGPADDARRDTR